MICPSVKLGPFISSSRQLTESPQFWRKLWGSGHPARRVWIAQAQRSISIALSHYLKERLDQYLNIEPKAPMINVPQIKLHALRDMFY